MHTCTRTRTHTRTHTRTRTHTHTRTALVHMIQGAMPDDDPSEMVEGITRDGNTIMLPREVFMRFNMTNS